MSRRARRRRLVRWTTALSAAAILVGILAYFQLTGMMPARQTAHDWYEVRADRHTLVSLPADDAPHDNYTEWWYYNGHLESQEGKRYSFHFVVFVINALATYTVVHASFTDLQTGTHHFEELRSGGNPSYGTVNGFQFDFQRFAMTGGDGNDHLKVATEPFHFDLRLTNRNPPVLQGGTGLLDFKQAGSSYYYSRSRMDIRGSAGIRGERQAVTGQAWFDHQWGDFKTTSLGWDWFAMQLDDGADIMLYTLFTREGVPVLHAGTYTEDGETTVLTEKDFSTEAESEWTSPDTGITYPMQWSVSIPGRGVEVQVKPLVENSEIDARKTAYMVYWEGAVQIKGSRTGRGFVELSGYKRREPPKTPHR